MSVQSRSDEDAAVAIVVAKRRLIAIVMVEEIVVSIEVVQRIRLAPRRIVASEIAGRARGERILDDQAVLSVRHDVAVRRVRSTLVAVVFTVGQVVISSGGLSQLFVEKEQRFLVGEEIQAVQFGRCLETRTALESAGNGTRAIGVDWDVLTMARKGFDWGVRRRMIEISFFGETSTVGRGFVVR